jgi:hypothetical protein
MSQPATAGVGPGENGSSQTNDSNKNKIARFGTLFCKVIFMASANLPAVGISFPPVHANWL